MKKILYTTEYGSTLYGTATPQSDKDYKSVFLPDLDDLLAQRNVGIINSKTNDAFGVKNTNEDIDHEMIPVQRFARDFLNGQTYAIEIAFSVMSFNHAGKQVMDSRFTTFVKNLIARYLNDSLKPMVRYAQAQANLYSDKGKRLLAIEKFRDKLKETLSAGTDPATKLDMLKDWVDTAKSQYMMIKSVDGSNNTQQVCIHLTGKLFPLNISLSEALSRVEIMIKNYGTRSKAAATAEGADYKALHHASRIALQASDLLSYGSIMFPYKADRISYLMSIKTGQMEYEKIVDNLAEILEKVDEQYNGDNVLRKFSDDLANNFEVFLEESMRDFYGIPQKKA